jgi:hydrogenase nickel incorporation protein HypB
MCVTCGCSDNAEVTITTVAHQHVLSDGTVITHSHEHHPPDDQTHHAHAGHSDHADYHHHPAIHEHNHSADQPQSNGAANGHSTAQIHAQMHDNTITLEQNILAKNDRIAAQNRGWFQGRNILALNLVSSPGSGKTTLLARTIQDLQAQIPISVIEGDQATANDAHRIQATGCPVVQINTGTGCHLEADMVERGLQSLNPPLHSILFIENVGNLVCPALFDLGEQAKVAILSVTEGEDKPIKYPHMFRASQVMILTKTDLLPYVPFDVDRCLAYAREVNPDIQIFQVSALSGDGLANWYEWLMQHPVHGR